VAFLPLYDFDLDTGNWTHRGSPVALPEFCLDQALASSADADGALGLEERRAAYEQALSEARALAQELQAGTPFEERVLEGEAGVLQYFTLPAVSCAGKARRAAG
jgi:hypothetical protein